MASPPLPPGYDKHHIVFLETFDLPLPDFSFPHTIEKYARCTPAAVKERMKKATIAIATVCPITTSDMDGAPNLQLVAILATGMGWVDRQYCANRGITVVNCPQSNVEAVGEHFLSLYFSSRRKIPEYTRAVTETDEWRQKGIMTHKWTQGPPLSCSKETLGIIGYGHLGKRFENLAKGVGFGHIIIGDRRGATEPRAGRVTLTDLLRTATTIVICCPRENDTINLIGKDEIAMMRKECLIINMARGGIINEQAVADALKEQRIFGFATDVLDAEPCGLGESPLLPDPTKGEKPIPNLIVTPHVAWNAARTLDVLRQLLKRAVDAFAEGKLDDEDVRDQVAVLDGTIFK